MNTKLKCLLLDDELPGLTYLKMLCDQLPALDVVKAFNSPEVFLREAKNLEFDICILDIEMPGLSGLQVAGLLRNKPVIFTTAYKEYAAEAFDLDAVDYVRKPVQRERLHQAVQKAVMRLKSTQLKNTFVRLNTDKGRSLIFFDQLLYIATAVSDSRDKIAHLVDGSTLTLKNVSFEKLQELLPTERYCRINKREMISLNIVHVFSYNEITTTLTTDTGRSLILSLSETYRHEFLVKIGAR
ncbi:MAG: response regulator [Cyclobacteriaceae bacterium]|nr:response regulator [Cyclobacteriaceae bacterium]